MDLAALRALACPACSGPLSVVGPHGVSVREGALRCKDDGTTYPVRDGVPILIRPSALPNVTAFATAYSAAWRKDGWGGSDERYLLQLPYRDYTGRQKSKWKVKARSLRALTDLLRRYRLRRIVDLGCGNGWLSYRLAERGYEVYAVDILTDNILGLGVADMYARRGPPFERVCGEMEHPPFLASSVDAVICNASLHYAESLEVAVRAIGTTLRTGGILCVMNSPVHRDSLSAANAQRDFRQHLMDSGADMQVVSSYSHFTRSQLESVLSSYVGPLHEWPFNPGNWFRVNRRIKGLVLRMELASFPILVAAKGYGAAVS